jgi:hypothetical protein
MTQILNAKNLPLDLNLPDVSSMICDNFSLDFLLQCCLQRVGNSSNTLQWQATQRLSCIFLRRQCKPSWLFLDELDGEVLDPKEHGVVLLGIKLPHIGFSSRFAKEVERWQKNDDALKHLESLANRSMDTECKSELIQSMSQSLRQRCNDVKNEGEIWSLPSKTLQSGFEQE